MEICGLMPGLDVIKPGVKTALCGDELVPFNKCFDWSTKPEITATQVMPDVWYFDDVLSTVECKSLCEQIDSCDHTSFWSPCGRQNQDTRNFRDADTVEMMATDISTLLWERISSHVNWIVDVPIDEPESGVWERDIIGSWTAVNTNHDVLLARYPSGGSFSPHTDGRAVHNFNRRSFYSIVLYLNDLGVTNGGGTRFFSFDAVNHLTQVDTGRWTCENKALILGEVQAKAGRMLVFEQSRVHEGVPPASGCLKYIIRSDVMFQRTPAVCDSESDRIAYAEFKQGEELAEAGHVNESIALFKKAFKRSPELAHILGH